MKSIHALLAVAALAAAVSTHAAPPPGHPSPAAAMEMMKAPSTSDADLTQKGKVVSTIDANEYTYVEVQQDKNTLWLAVPKVALKKDATIRFEDGAVMSNFRSKLLNRTFPSIMFVNRVLVVK